MNDRPASVIGLDLGAARIGVSRALWPDGIPVPLACLNNDSDLLVKLSQLIAEENSQLLVVGRPRNLSGTDTAQTRFSDELASRIKDATGLPLFFQDEAATSLKAEAELKSRNKPYDKGDIDSLSATYILEDFINEHPKGVGVEV